MRLNTDSDWLFKLLKKIKGDKNGQTKQTVKIENTQTRTCLSVSNDGIYSNINVVPSIKEQATSQWIMEPTIKAKNTFRFKNVANGLYLTADPTSTGTTMLATALDNSYLSQIWIQETLNDGSFLLQSLSSKRYPTVIQNNDNFIILNIRNAQSSVWENQKWSFTAVSPLPKAQTTNTQKTAPKARLHTLQQYL